MSSRGGGESEGSGDDQLPLTARKAYTDRLSALAGSNWKRRLHVQAPWHAQLRWLRLGRTLDVGCGTGRNLRFLDHGSVGVDHNPFSVEAARALGCTAVTTAEFFAEPALAKPGGFDSILASHLVEHLEEGEAEGILRSYLPYLRPEGRLVFMTPQERGFASDATHVLFHGFDELGRLASDLGLEVVKSYSFPFPRWVGRYFTYNEFVVVASAPSAA